MMTTSGYSRFVFAMCGICGLVFGIDLGIVGAALPYIKETVGFTEAQLSSVTAAVLLGSVFGTVVAAAVAEKFGRVMAIRLAAAVFTLAVPVICFSDGNFTLMYAGRILQGLGCGLACVAGPLYLAECMSAAKRGRGAGMFQLVIVIGLFVAALVGLAVAATLGAATDPNVSVAIKTVAWKAIFWSSAVPGAFLFVGSFVLRESPRWLSRRGRRDEALAALCAGNPEDEARAVMDEIVASEESEHREKEALAAAKKGDTIFRRRYMIPFLLSLAVAVSVQASGINSVLNYSVMIMDRAGFKEIWANWADVAIKAANFLMTIVACLLVDRKGRKFLLTVGSGGLLVGTLCVGGVFLAIERFGVAPSLTTGLVTLAAFILYVSAFAVGPGVCVHLALTELMPTRIRAAGMLVATMCNNAVSFTIAQTFLPWSKAWGSSAVFFTLSGFMVLFFCLVTIFLPETKGKSLEEIERMFVK